MIARLVHTLIVKLRVVGQRNLILKIGLFLFEGRLDSGCLSLIRRVSGIILTILLLLSLSGCQRGESDRESAVYPSQRAPYIELGDLGKIKKRGKIRILLTGVSADVGYLPRQGLPIHFETELVTRLAGHLGVEPELIYAPNFEQLIPMLLAGKGDIIASNVTVTNERKKTVAFSVPVTIVREQLVVRADQNINSLSDLNSRPIALQKSSSYWETVDKLRKTHTGLKVEWVVENYTVEQILDGVVNGKYVATIADSNLISAILPYQTKLKPAFDVSGDRAIAWAMRPGAFELKKAVDKYLTTEHLTSKKPEYYKADLPEIKQRKVLRVLTRNNAATYYLWRGELLGFEYELMRKFADRQRVRLEMIVAPSRRELIEWLRESKGDLVTASLTVQDDYAKNEFIFSSPYNSTSEILVTRSSDRISSVADLKGRTVYVRRSSSYWATLIKLLRQGVSFSLKPVSEKLETEDIIDKVATGEFDLTVADGLILNIELSWRDDIKAGLVLRDKVNYGWLLRNDSPMLVTELNKFIKKEYKGLYYNVIYRKYFQDTRQPQMRLSERSGRQSNHQLSPYDDIVKKQAKFYGFDWRLIVAQIYQESRFNPHVKS